MCETPPRVDDELLRRLREHLDQGQLVELTAVVCLENVRSRFSSAVGLPRVGCTHSAWARDGRDRRTLE
jgi:alkylhydroperoxidase family enzyme